MQRYKQITYNARKNKSILLMIDKKILKENISMRFIAVCQYLNERYNISSDRAFSKKIGMHPQTFSDIKNKKLQVGLDYISNLLTVFPNVNLEFIILGVGDILKYQTNSQKDAIEHFNRYIKNDLHPKDIDGVIKKIIDAPIYQKDIIDKLVEISAENALLKKEVEELKAQKKARTVHEPYSMVAESKLEYKDKK